MVIEGQIMSFVFGRGETQVLFIPVGKERLRVIDFILIERNKKN